MLAQQPIKHVDMRFDQSTIDTTTRPSRRYVQERVLELDLRIARQGCGKGPNVGVVFGDIAVVFATRFSFWFVLFHL